MRHSIPQSIVQPLKLLALFTVALVATTAQAAPSMRTAGAAFKNQFDAARHLTQQLPNAANRAPGPVINAGLAAVSITPKFERYNDLDNNKKWAMSEPFYDTGRDGFFDIDEPGALGPDGEPGWALVDDNGDGLIDNVEEFGWPGSDDVVDVSGDNFHWLQNPNGTEGNGQFDWTFIGGFGPYVPFTELRVANGVLNDVWSRAVVLEKDGVKIALVSTDLPGLLWKHINPVKRRAEQNLGIPFDNIMICSTHNHGGPDPTGYWLTLAGSYDKQYTDWMMDQIYASIEQAHDTMVPCHQKVNQRHHISCYDPVTKELKRYPNCREPDYLEAFKLPGNLYDSWLLQNDLRDPIIRNTEVTAMQWTEVGTGRVVGTLVNWHDHPEMLTDTWNWITSDFCHYVRERVELEYGGVCAYFSGTFGNQIGALRGTPAPLVDENWNWVFSNENDINGNPFPVLEGNSSIAKLRSVGAIIAETAIEALAMQPDIDPDPVLSVQSERIPVRVDNVIYYVIGRTHFVNDPYIEAPDRVTFGAECDPFLGCVPCDLQVIRIGETEIITAPGEVDPSYFLGRHASWALYEPDAPDYYFPAMPALRDAMTGKYRFMVGNANNYLSYLVHEDDFLPVWENLIGEITGDTHPNWYEDMVSFGTKFGDQVGNKLFEMLGSNERFNATNP